MQKKIDQYLDAADGFSALASHARLLIKLAQVYKAVAPPALARSSALSNYDSGTLLIRADNSLVAAKLRQIIPTLIEGFCKRGIQCSGVHVKVQALKLYRESLKPTLKPIHPRGRKSIETLRDSLPPSANSLREALEKLLERAPKT